MSESGIPAKRLCYLMQVVTACLAQEDVTHEESAEVFSTLMACYCISKDLKGDDLAKAAIKIIEIAELAYKKKSEREK